MPLPKWCFLKVPSICQAFGVLFLCVVLLVFLLLHINSCCQYPLGLIDRDGSRPLLDLHKDAVSFFSAQIFHFTSRCCLASDIGVAFFQNPEDYQFVEALALPYDKLHEPHH